MTIQLSSIPSLVINEQTFNYYPVTVDNFIRHHSECLRARGCPVDEISINTAQEQPFNEADLNICTQLLYSKSLEIEWNLELFYRFSVFFQIDEISDRLKEWIEEELAFDKFWKVYIKPRKLNVETSFFEEAIKIRLSGTNAEKFKECTKKLFEDMDVDDIAAVAELLSKVNDVRMFPVVLHLADTVIKRRREEPGFINGSPANREYLQTIVSCICTYIEKHGLRGNSERQAVYDAYIQKLKTLPMPYHDLKAVSKVTILIIKLSSPTYHFAHLPEMDQLTRTQDTLKIFMELARDVIHPCVVAEIAFKWARLPGLGDSEIGEVKDIVKTLLKDLESSYPQWYNSFCIENRHKTFIENRLGLTLPSGSSYQYLTDKSKNALIRYIKEGSGEEREFTVEGNSDERVRGFKYINGNLPPYGDIPDHWFINTVNTVNTVNKYVSFIVDSKSDILTAINDRNENERILVSLCRVPAPTAN